MGSGEEKGTGTFIIDIFPRRVCSFFMPRAARASVGGICYRAINRGNGRRTVFHKEGDYEAFLQAMDPLASRFRWECYRNA